jgi:hypothetical protein
VAAPSRAGRRTVSCPLGEMQECATVNELIFVIASSGEFDIWGRRNCHECYRRTPFCRPIND